MAVDEGIFQNIVEVGWPTGVTDSGGYYVAAFIEKEEFVTPDFFIYAFYQLSKFSNASGSQSTIRTQASPLNGTTSPINFVTVSGLERIGDNLYIAIIETDTWSTGPLTVTVSAYIQKINLFGSVVATKSYGTSIPFVPSASSTLVPRSIGVGTDFRDGSIKTNLYVALYPFSTSSGGGASVQVLDENLSVISASSGLSATYSSSPMPLINSDRNNDVRMSSYHSSVITDGDPGETASGIRYFYGVSGGWRAVQGTSNFEELNNSSTSDQQVVITRNFPQALTGNIAGGFIDAFDPVTGASTGNVYGSALGDGRFSALAASDDDVDIFYTGESSSGAVRRVNSSGSTVWSTSWAVSESGTSLRPNMCCPSLIHSDT